MRSDTTNNIQPDLSQWVAFSKNAADDIFPGATPPPGINKIIVPSSKPTGIGPIKSSRRPELQESGDIKYSFFRPTYKVQLIII